MDWHAYVRTQLAEITGDAARDEEIVEELAQHLALRFEEARAAGATADEARRTAASELRPGTQLARAIRAADEPRPVAPAPPSAERRHLMRDLWQDIRFAIRQLARAPGFAVATVVTLTLGIGMTAAIFSVVDGVLLRPTPYPAAGRLMMMWETDRASGTSREPGSFPDFLDYQQRSRTMERVGAFMAFDATLQPDRGEPARVAAVAATPEVLELLGIRPLAGRIYTAEDDRSGAPATALISERLWNAAYDRGDVVGRTLRINGINDLPRTVIGVVPTDADFGLVQILLAADYGGGFATRDPRTRVDVWTPLQADAQQLPRRNHPLLMLGRAREGVDRAAAQDELARIARDLEVQYPTDNDSRGISVEPLQDVIFGPVGPPLTVLMTAVGLVLLMTCVNVANLLLVRGARRVREVAIRAALGARMNRLVRQFVAENLVLSVGSGVVALLLAAAGLRVLMAMAPGDIPRLADVGVDGRVVMLALGCSAFIGVVFSLVPLIQARREDLQVVLRAEDSRGTSGRDGQFLRSSLVVTEVALAVVLVTSAGLLIKSFWHLRSTSPGFAITGVLKAEFLLPQSRYPVVMTPRPSSAAIVRFNGDLSRAVSALPGVTSVSFAANHPLDGGSASSFEVVGREGEAASWPEISIRRVAPGYFETLRIPLVSGRFLQEGDAASGPSVVINQEVAGRFFQGQDPVGHRLGFWGAQWTIVGVIGNERFQGVARELPIAVYLPLEVFPSNAQSIIVRTSGDPVTLGTAVRAAVRELDPMLVVFGLEPLENTLSQSLNEQRFLMVLLVLFAALALVLAAVGIHGVLSYTVAHRSREIGIRMALGANAQRVVRAVVAQGATLTVLGLVLGFALAMALGRFLSALLFGVTPRDAATLATVIVVLGVVATVSVWLPARRAVRVDPLVALRQE